MPEHFVIAIDGPAGSGKSTTAAGVARKLGIAHLDTGAMYRAITYVALKKKIEVGETRKLKDLSQNCRITFRKRPKAKPRVFLNGADVTRKIRTPQVTRAVVEYCQVPALRKALVKKQRALAANQSLVLEGRDIGTVVFPRAKYKFFITASLAERAKRRLREWNTANGKTDLTTLKKALRLRDKKDSGRKISPLKRAKDAVKLDNTNMNQKEQVQFILKFINP